MTDKQMIERCINCKYLYEGKAGTKGSLYHECKRNAPSVMPYEGYEEGVGWWPSIKLDDWCGEFQPSPLNENEVGESE